MENWVCVVFCFFLFMLGFANPGVSTADDLAYRRHELLEILTSARIPESDIDSLGDHQRLSVVPDGLSKCTCSYQIRSWLAL